jgi:hypothetical protein
MALTLRSSKQQALTWTEVDANWETLQQAAEAAQSTANAAMPKAGGTFTGTVLFGPDAIAWDDLLGAAITLQQSGPGVSRNVAENQVEFTTAANLSDYLIDSQQMSHAWNLQAVSPHLHAWQTTAAAPNWLLQYRWQVMGKLKTAAWTDIRCNVPAFTYPGAGTFHQLFYTAANIEPPAGAGISDIIQFRVLRDNANTSGKFTGADPVNATAAVTSFDTHYAKDTLGSRLVATKY